LHRLSSSFVLGFHGCDREVAEKILCGDAFQSSNNDFDWLGPGIYFWEANPQRALDFAREMTARKTSPIREPSVVGAIIDLGLCLDLSTKESIDLVANAYQSLEESFARKSIPLPKNSEDLLRRNLDCAVIRRLHEIVASADSLSIQTVKGIFIEGGEIYPNSGFHQKTHVQIAVRDLACIKGVFRVPYPA
jgi:hypothetical protein